MTIDYIDALHSVKTLASDDFVFLPDNIDSLLDSIAWLFQQSDLQKDKNLKLSHSDEMKLLIFAKNKICQDSLTYTNLVKSLSLFSRYNDSVTMAKTFLPLRNVQKDAVDNVVGKFLKDKKPDSAFRAIELTEIRDAGLVSRVVSELVSSRKGHVADEMLNSDPKLQRDIVTSLDRQLGKGDKRSTYSKCEPQQVAKWIKKTAINSKIPSQCYKNTITYQLSGKLGFLMRLHYKGSHSKSISICALVENIRHIFAVESSVLGTKQITGIFLTTVRQFAAPFFNQWKYFLQNMDKEDFDYSILERKGRVEQFYSLPSSVEVVFVDKPQHLEEVINFIATNCDKIGVDAELCLGSSQSRDSDLALLQLSTTNTVFIIDYLSLKSELGLWDLLMSSVIANKDISKIGFGVENDISYIKSTTRMQSANIIELDKVSPNLLSKSDNLSRFVNTPWGDSPTGLKGLSKLCCYVFGRKLDKSECLSDWTLRPLRSRQLAYAALDAYISVELHEASLLVSRMFGHPSELRDNSPVYVIKHEENAESSDVSRLREVGDRQQIPIFVDERLSPLGRLLRKDGRHVIFGNFSGPNAMVVKVNFKEDPSFLEDLYFGVTGRSISDDMTCCAVCGVGDNMRSVECGVVMSVWNSIGDDVKRIFGRRRYLRPFGALSESIFFDSRCCPNPVGRTSLLSDGSVESIVRENMMFYYYEMTNGDIPQKWKVCLNCRHLMTIS